MAGRAAEVFLVTALAAAVTAVMAFTVLRAPGERVFGMAIVGTHHDPFTVMAQFDGAPRPAIYLQPVTDIAGGLIAKVIGGVNAYNAMVLLSFPLAAAAAYLLARHLAIGPAASAVAAMAFAFSPFHVAHAAYHPHIAQVQWVPLFLLALWRCLDFASASRMAMLAGAVVLVTLSNFYGGLIAAVITPAAVGARMLFGHRNSGSRRSFVLTISTLALVAAAGLGYVALRAPAVGSDASAYAFRQSDIAKYSAAPMSFLTPPVAHPFLGGPARRAMAAAGVGDGLLEQQVYIGWGLIVLAIVAAVGWSADQRGHVAIVFSVAATAMFFAIWPPAWLYGSLPMFRSFARFGVVVQLMTVLLAGIGFDRLWRMAPINSRLNSRLYLRRAAAVGLVVLVAVEYAVPPLAMSRRVPAAERASIESWHRITKGLK